VLLPLLAAACRLTARRTFLRLVLAEPMFCQQKAKPIGQTFPNG